MNCREMSHFDQLIFFKEVGNWYLEVAEWTEDCKTSGLNKLKPPASTLST